MKLPIAFTSNILVRIDAVTCGAFAALLLAGAGPLGDWLDLPAGFLRSVGVVLVPWTLLLVVLGNRERVSRMAMIDVIAVNLLWVAGSVIVLVADWVEPNGFGIAFVVVQAVAVGLLAAIQAETLMQEGNDPTSRVARA